MNVNSLSDTVLDEIWAIKDRLSASSGHELSETCREIYAEQALHPERFLVLRRKANAQQAGSGQTATRPESDTEGSNQPQPEAEGRSR
jgi:hypothetical protein